MVATLRSQGTKGSSHGFALPECLLLWPKQEPMYGAFRENEVFRMRRAGHVLNRRQLRLSIDRKSRCLWFEFASRHRLVGAGSCERERPIISWCCT